MTSTDPRASDIGRPPPETIAPLNNIAVFVEHWARRTPQRMAMAFPTGVDDAGRVEHDVITFGALHDAGRRFGQALQAGGLQKGDRVLLMVPISRALYTALIGIVAAGGVAVFLDPWMKLPQLRRALSATKPKVFIGVPKAHLLLRPLLPELRAIPRKIVAGGPRLLGEPLGDVVRSAVAQVPLMPMSLDDEALITFTTGSTGTPKVAARTHGFLNVQGDILAHALPREPGDVDMPSLPIFALLNLASGVPSVFPLVNWKRVADVNPAHVTQQIDAMQVTTIGGSPSYLAPIARYCKDEHIVLPRVRGVVAGGAAVSSSLLADLERMCPRAVGTIRVLFGSTEVEPVAEIDAREVLTDVMKAGEGRGTCVGRVHPSLALKLLRPTPGPIVLDAEGFAPFEVAEGEPGEIVVAGPHVQDRYVDDDEAMRLLKIRGPDGTLWHRMGDVATRDEQGRLWLLGRVGDAVMADDKQVYPLQVEPLLDGSLGVRRAGLVAVAGKPVLAIELQDGASAPVKTAEVKSLLEHKRIAIHDVRVVKHIPVDPRHNAKIQRRALARMLGGAP